MRSTFRSICVMTAVGATVVVLGSSAVAGQATTVVAQPAAPVAVPALGGGEDDILSGTEIADLQPDGVDPGNGDLVGTPLSPSRDVAKTKKEQAAVRGEAAAPAPKQKTTTRSLTAEADAAGDIAGFGLSTWVPKPVNVGARAYEDTKITDPNGFGTVDNTGVRMFIWPGNTEKWEHPVAQIQYGLTNLNSYRLTKDARYLEIAKKNAQRNIDRRVESGDAWYYPYDFDFAVHGDTTQTLKAPWYSAMAQGQAVSLFTRLYEYTKDPAWKEAADRSFASLRQVPVDTAPFASRVDSAGRLWFEEYPRYPVEESEQVLNGHIYVLFGIHDYWRLTEDPVAERLFRGGLYTVEQTVMNGYRRVNWASVYSLHHAQNTLTYHKVHVAQFLVLWRLTHAPFWINAATAYRNDFPQKYQSGAIRISPRAKVIYRTGSDGSIIESKAVSFSRYTGAPFDRRERLKNGPVAYRVTAGAYTGWWFPEGFGVTWALGSVDRHGYLPKTFIMFRGGTTFSAYKLDSKGQVVGSKTLTIPTDRESGAPTKLSGIVQGRPAYYFEIGAFAGYWVPLQSKVYVKQAYLY